MEGDTTAGTGLGLPICRALVEAMGGEITADSSPGRGAMFAFTLTLPRAGQDAPGAADTTSPDEAPQAVRILYAEDNPINQQVVELMLKAAGVNAVCVENGALAVESWAGGGYDMVLMDIQMSWTG